MNLFLSPSGIKHSVTQKKSLEKVNFCSLFKPKKESMSLVRLRMDLAESQTCPQATGDPFGCEERFFWPMA